MAALVAGVQYGLSSHSTFHENKSLIFVKLTDSAQRAIEDFLRNRNKINQNPTIQFLGNEGQLSFPSTQSSHGSAGFTFSLSGNQDIEGPQGGFECIQQTGPTSLESLGALPCKMRIQANDDVYETTKHRMVVAEENSKNKCTRVIKPNGPDIGRKVKVKGTGRTIPPPSNSNSRHRESTSIPTSASSQSRLSSSSSASSSSYKATPSSNSMPVRSQPEKKVSDIMRRPLKERLIHLLALRPYKKPELYDRINREGIKERERSIMTMILKQVAFMRDNTYHLHRHVWNDVQEDWPYYTEQEKAMLKRRKPQNLTPPGSSDGGSSGSGQSPNSTHPGSPPGITAPPPSLVSSKRPGYYQGNDGLPTKRPRISHYRKPESSNANTTSSSSLSSTSTSSKGNSENGRTAGSSGGSNSNSVVSGGIGSGSVGGCVSGGGNSSNSNNNNNNNSGGLFDVWEQRQQQRERRTATDYRGERTSNSGEQVLRSGGTSYVKSCLSSSNGADDSSNQLDHHHHHHRNEGGNDSTYSSSTSHNNSSSSHSGLTHSNASSCNSRHHHYVGGGNSSGSGSVSSGSGGGKSALSTGDNIDYVAARPISGVNSSAAATAGNASIANITVSATSTTTAGTGSTTIAGAYSGLPNGSVVTSSDRRDRSERSRGDRDRESRRRSNNTNNNNAVGSSIANSYDLSSSYNGNTEDTTVSTSTTCNVDTPESPKSSEYPDYLTCYTTISSAEQRRRYKEEFNADYEEYKRLHAQVVKVSKRFTQLEERLKQEEAIGNWEGFKEVERQICTEYNETKRDPVYRETKRRFHYLHEKLSHLKRLVLEYDTQNTATSSMMITSTKGTGTSSSSNSSTTTKGAKDMDSLHY